MSKQILIELSDRQFQIVTKEELEEMEKEAMEFDGFFGWRVVGECSDLKDRNRHAPYERTEQIVQGIIDSATNPGADLQKVKESWTEFLKGFISGRVHLIINQLKGE